MNHTERGKLGAKKRWKNHNRIAKFWSNVAIGKPNECWPWKLSTRRGYGRCKFKGRTECAHRVAYKIHFGKIKLMALHQCDNPICCNPNHLFEGTQKENVHDCFNKGRANRANSFGKLTKSDANKIINLCRAKKKTQAEIAKIFGIDQSIVSKLKNGKWVHAG